MNRTNNFQILLILLLANIRASDYQLELESLSFQTKKNTKKNGILCYYTQK